MPSGTSPIGSSGESSRRRAASPPQVDRAVAADQDQLPAVSRLDQGGQVSRVGARLDPHVGARRSTARAASTFSSSAVPAAAFVTTSSRFK